MEVPEVVRPLRSRPSRKRHSTVSLLIIAGLLLSSGANAAVGRLLLSENGETPAGSLTGMTEVTVAAPFELARVTISIDGETVARNLQRPYRLEIDFGPVPIEHLVAVTATNLDRSRTVRWSQVINKGQKPLAVVLRAIPGTRTFEADVTTLPGDPVTGVEFYNATGLIGKAGVLPYRVELPLNDPGEVVRVTVRTKSGAEATDVLAGSGNVHAESYDVRTVKLLVSVLDRNGSVASKLESSSFEILDKGRSGKILGVSSAFEQPISVALLLDASASMGYAMPSASKAALAFARKILRPQDHCSVFSVRTVPRREQALTSDQSQIAAALSSIKAAGETSIYDAIRSAIRDLAGENDRRAIVILSDGGDTASIATYDETLQLVRAAGIPIYVIAYNEVPEFAADRDRLSYLASETGGFLISANAADLSRKYGEIEKDLRGQYAISYQITDASRPNEWRDVKVRVRPRELTARTISGYFVLYVDA